MDLLGDFHFMQSKTQSLIEATLNALSGYLIAVGAQVLIFPWFGIHIPLHENFIMAFLFTLISIVRSYFWRRFFNSYLLRKTI